MKRPLTDLRVQRSERSLQVGMNKQDLTRDVGFEVVFLDGGAWVNGRKVQSMFGR